jgi:PKD repeat protein
VCGHTRGKKSWRWEFGDGTVSTERNPLHIYEKPGEYVVVLAVEGPAGSARMTKVWDITVK